MFIILATSSAKKHRHLVSMKSDDLSSHKEYFKDPKKGGGNANGSAYMRVQTYHRDSYNKGVDGFLNLHLLLDTLKTMALQG